MTELGKWGRDMFSRSSLDQIKDHAGSCAIALYAAGNDEDAAKFQKLADAIFELYLD